MVSPAAGILFINGSFTLSTRCTFWSSGSFAAKSISTVTVYRDNGTEEIEVTITMREQDVNPDSTHVVKW